MKNSLRITGGELKGKKIPFDFKSSLRPTSSKLREVLFNWLQFDIKDFQCLDVFAGTGALGIEALSRGAKKTVFIELNKKNYLALKECISKFDLVDQSMLLFRDGLSWIKENDLSTFDLILLDPPFNQDYEKKILELLYMNKNLKSSCKIYIEYSKFSDIEMPESFEIIKEKIIGDVKALLIKKNDI